MWSEGGVVVLAVNTLGCLYLLTNQNATVTSFEDLRGKTVYVPAQNPTFIFTYLCKQNGLNVGTDITIDSTTYAQPAALKDAVAAGAHAGKLVGAVAAVTGGKGGGRPDNAMAGGRDASQIDAALAVAKVTLEGMIK